MAEINRLAVMEGSQGRTIMEALLTTLVLAGFALLRFGLPLLVISLIAFLLHRLEAHWQMTPC